MGAIIGAVASTLIGEAGRSKGVLTSKTMQGVAGLYFAPEIATHVGPIIQGAFQIVGFLPPSDALLQSIVVALAALWAVYGRFKAEKPLARRKRN